MAPSSATKRSPHSLPVHVQLSSTLRTIANPHPHHGFPPPPASPPAPLRFHGDNNIAACPPFGDAVRICSTPVNSVIAVGELVAEPSVATIMTALPFCKSAMVTAGSRLSIC